MKKKKTCIIAIDGPSGTGKSTVAKCLARRLSGRILDTGATYRSVGYYALKEKAETPGEFGKIARRLKFSPSKTGRVLLVNGKNLGKRLRQEKVSAMASHVSKFKSVRSVLTAKQRALGKEMSKRGPIIAEGRDIGTVVFPRGAYKFFLTAKDLIRAQRRQAQLRRMGDRKITVAEVRAKQAHRDRQDSTRKLAPLKKARDAVVLDTSRMGIAEVVETILDHLPE